MCGSSSASDYGASAVFVGSSARTSRERRRRVTQQAGGVRPARLVCAIAGWVGVYIMLKTKRNRSKQVRVIDVNPSTAYICKCDGAVRPVRDRSRGRPPSSAYAFVPWAATTARRAGARAICFCFDSWGLVCGARECLCQFEPDPRPRFNAACGGIDRTSSIPRPRLEWCACPRPPPWTPPALGCLDRFERGTAARTTQRGDPRPRHRAALLHQLITAHGDDRCVGREAAGARVRGRGCTPQVAS